MKVNKFLATIVSASVAMSMLPVSSSASEVDVLTRNEIAEIKSDVLRLVESCCVSESGEVIDTVITDISVEAVEVPSTYALQDGVTRAYVTKVKTSTGNYNNYGIRANSALTMTWVDGPGADNKIIGLEGYWSIASGTFTKGELHWGSDYTGPTFAPYSQEVSENFDISVNYTSTDDFSGTLKAHSIAYIKSPQNGTIFQFSTVVSPTILD